MFVTFESLPAASSVWIFQANRPFTKTELPDVHNKLRAFTEEWSVHGMPLNTSYSVQFNQFVVLAADESQQTASGCSIDSSVRAMKTLEQSLGIDLFDRNQVAFKKEDQVVLIPLSGIKEKFRNGTLNADTLTFNNLVGTREEFEQRWIVPVSDTWLKRYMSDPLVKVD